MSERQEHKKRYNLRTEHETFAVGCTPQPTTVIIKGNKILICDKVLNIEIDITDSLKRIDKIIVNDIEFVRSEKGGASDA